MDKKQEDCIRECIREIDTIKKRLVGLLSNQRVDVFEKPEFNDVLSYFKTSLDGVDTDCWRKAQSFYDYYQANGWKVGKNKMKNWKAAASQWIARGKNREKNKRPSRSDRHDEATRTFLQSQ